MTQETRPAPLDAHGRRRVSFDPTINLGHVLTGLMMLAAGFASYSTIDKRVTSLETAQTMSERHQRERDAQQDQLIRDSVGDIKQTMREVKQSMDDLRRNGKP